MSAIDWQQQADQYLMQADYIRAANLCEQAIELHPEERMPYWYLGMLSLLQGQEAEAQAIWFTGMVSAEPEQLEQWTLDLITVLQQEAERQETSGDRQTAWLLRQHIREIDPGELDNLLRILALSLQLEQFDPEDVIQPAIALLQARSLVNTALLLEVLKQLLQQQLVQPIASEFAAATLPYADSAAWIGVLLSAAIALATSRSNTSLACRYAELCLQLDAQHPIALMSLSRFYQTEGRYAESVEIARRYSDVCQNLTQKIVANTLVLKGLISQGSAWTVAEAVQQDQIALLQDWLKAAMSDELPDANVLCSSLFFAPYFGDRPRETRLLQNQVAQRYQSALHTYVDRHCPEYQSGYQLHNHRSADRKALRIGYLSRCLRQHSVGWLCRWLFHHFECGDRFEVYAYFLQPQLEPFSEQWFATKVNNARCVTGEAVAIAQQIQADEIGILVDLDSITTPATCEVMALKPAPIQVTWLGMDASSLPAIDYFIADPHVLPAEAQEYYAERIWRLPQTYIAVDGFEVGIPTLRRDQLEIPGDAIVYFSSQSAYKRHPETARSQMQILQQVPNSYFLIKGVGDAQGIQTFFEQIAAEVGVNRDRLRFLAIAPDEQTHRANLAIADVVLDTFPYNGATTTLETLWMGIPLVTQVGTQFASRNSYTMMLNVGVTEGIAQTSEEYVIWGVRLGRDAALRQQVIEKLRQARRTSPLWNGRQFARDMEQAYEQMWQHHLQRTLCFPTPLQ